MSRSPTSQPPSNATATNRPTSSSTVTATAPLKPEEILPNLDAQQNSPTAPAARPPARPQNPTTNQPTQGQDQQPAAPQQPEEGQQQEDGGGLLSGLGKMAKNGMSPWLLLFGMGAAAMFGAPSWMIIAGGLVGLLLITAGRNGSDDPSPQSGADISLGTANDPQRGRGLELARDGGGDISLGAATPNSNSRTTQNGDISLGASNAAISSATINGGLPQLNGVQLSNADSVLPPVNSPVSEQARGNSAGVASIM
jgi:hypothetical protein